MGYRNHCVDRTLADVIADTPDHDDHVLEHDDWWLYDSHWDYGYIEDDREPYYHGIDLEYDFDEPDEPDLGHDPYEHLPFTGHTSRGWAVPGAAPPCPYGCCHDKRLRYRHRPKYNIKPKRKDHRR